MIEITIGIIILILFVLLILSSLFLLHGFAGILVCYVYLKTAIQRIVRWLTGKNDK